MKQALIKYFSFSINPLHIPALSKSNKLVYFLTTLVITYCLLFVFTLLFFFVFKSSAQEEPKIQANFTLFSVMCLIILIPLYEEVLFRLPLIPSKRNILSCASLAL